MDQTDCDGLLGFAIHRTDHIEDEAYWMQGIKTFADTDPGYVAGSTYSTRQHPIQGFNWSANFREASPTKNDENMLIVRNNDRVADIYLGELMRLHNHHAFREFLEKANVNTLSAKPSHLSTGDWSRDYFGDTTRSRQLQFFAV
ncbi:hypothetical protein [uncultured Rubinisphaera sp.]